MKRVIFRLTISQAFRKAFDLPRLPHYHRIPIQGGGNASSQFLSFLDNIDLYAWPAFVAPFRSAHDTRDGHQFRRMFPQHLRDGLFFHFPSSLAPNGLSLGEGKGAHSEDCQQKGDHAEPSDRVLSFSMPASHGLALNLGSVAMLQFITSDLTCSYLPSIDTPRAERTGPMGLATA